MRVVLLMTIFAVILQNNHYALANLQATSQTDLGDPCQLVAKGSLLRGLPENLHHLPLSYGYNRLPIEFYIDNNMPEYLIGPTHEVTSEWNTEAGFEVVTIGGNLDSVNMMSTLIDFADQRNTIYWGSGGIFNHPSTLAAVIRPLPSPVTDTPNAYLQFHKISIAINGSHSHFDVINQTEDLLNTMRQRIEIFQDAGLEGVPPNYLQDIETFTETGNIMINFVQNADVPTVRDVFIKLFELQRQNLNPADFANDNEMQAQTTYFTQLIEAFRSMPDEFIIISQDRMIVTTENLFARDNFDLLIQRARYITHFKIALKHQIGHALGLLDIFDEDVLNITDQMPLMWYRFHEGVDSNTAPYFENPPQVDHLVLHALSCTYNLEALRQTQPQG